MMLLFHLESLGVLERMRQLKSLYQNLYPLMVNTLDAGTYSIYTIPGENEWVIAFNSETDYWGRSLFGSPFKKEKDVFRINVTPKTSESVTETFTISMKEVSETSVIVTMAWDQTSVASEMMF